jgi:hypothetical protein
VSQALRIRGRDQRSCADDGEEENVAMNESADLRFELSLLCFELRQPRGDFSGVTLSQSKKRDEDATWLLDILA